MATTASQNFRTEFDSLVKQDYQNGSLLSGTVRTRTNVNAKTHRFPKLGKGVASLRIPQTDITPMNVQHTFADATLVDYDASDYSAVEDLDKLSFDERRELMMSVNKAIGRRLDQLIIDAMDTSASSTQVSDDLGGTDSSLNIEKILRAGRIMTAAGVPMEGRCMIINAIALENALQETEIASADYNTFKAMAMGDLNTFAGFKFITIEDRANEGGLPLVSGEPNVRNCFAYHRDAVGLALTGGIRTSVDWVAEKKSWLISGSLTGGAVTVDTDGVIDVLVYEA